MTAYCFLDLETTGLNPEVAEIWEIGAVLRDADGTRREQSAMFAPNLGTAEPEALRVGRFHERFDIDLCDDPRAQAHIIASELAGRVLVTSNSGFDPDFLARFLRAHEVEPTWHFRPLNVQDLAAGWLMRYSYPLEIPWCSTDLSRVCGVEPPGPEERHTALGDARWVERWFDAVTQPASGVAP